MVRNNRHVIRLCFLLVLASAFFGWWFASRFWQIDPQAWLVTSASEGGDWIDVVSAIAEQVLQLFLGLASSG